MIDMSRAVAAFTDNALVANVQADSYEDKNACR